MKYKTITVEVDAIRYITGDPIPSSWQDFMKKGGAEKLGATEGDYIVRYPNLTVQVYSPSEFRKTFVSTCTCGAGCGAQ